MTDLPSLDTLWNPPALDNPEGMRRWLKWLKQVRSAYPDNPGIQEQVTVCERLGLEYLRRLSEYAEPLNTPPADAA